MKWICHILDQPNTSLIGEFFLPEISNDIADDGEEWIVETRITEGNLKDEGMINQFVKKEAAKSLLENIKNQFVQELKKK